MTEPEPEPLSPLEVLAAIQDAEGGLDAVRVAELAPDVLIDPGGNGWPPLFDEVRLIPRLRQAVVALEARVAALEEEP